MRFLRLGEKPLNLRKDVLDIAFMFPPGGDAPFFSHHLGVAYLQAYLRPHGISTTQVLPKAWTTLNDCADSLLATNAPIIGFTCFDTNFYLVRQIAALAKKRCPDLVVLAGGPSATFSDKMLLDEVEEIDVCIRHEGEETMLELASLIIGSHPVDMLHDVQGVTFRRGNSVISTPDRLLLSGGFSIQDALDVLPSPFLSGILNGTESAGILTARGCPYSCTYCNFSAMSRHTVRYHSIDRVIAELRVIDQTLKSKAEINSNGANQQDALTVSIHDDAFALNPRRAKRICRRIIEEGISLQLSCLCRCDNLDDELVELFHMAGFTEISFGLESAVPRVLRNIKKVRKGSPPSEADQYQPEVRFLARARKAVSLAKAHNIHTHVSYIVGLPGETREDGNRTVEFVRRLYVDRSTHNLLMAFPGTELFEQARKWGISVMPSAFGLPYDTIHAYPVHEVPFPNNSSLSRTARLMARRVLLAFTGGTITPKNDNTGVILALIQTGKNGDFMSSFNWLSRCLAVNGGVVAVGDGVEPYARLKRMITANAASGMPTRECIYLKQQVNDGGHTTNKLVHALLHGSMQFPLTPLRLSANLNRHDEVSLGINDYPINKMEQQADVVMLKAIADIELADDSQARSSCSVYLDGVVLDGCRWGSSTCPAAKLQRIVIGEGGDVRPCFAGQPLGTTKDDFKLLRERGAAIISDVMETRNCAVCIAKDWCSKCPFPFPLSVEEFCELQRQGPSISRLVTRTKIAHTLDPRMVRTGFATHYACQVDEYTG